MFTNYFNTVSVIDTPTVLFEVAAGKTMLILEIAVAGGPNGGTLTMTANNGVADVFSWNINLSAGENADLSPQKIRLFSEGYTLSVKGSSLGLSCFLSCVEK